MLTAVVACEGSEGDAARAAHDLHAAVKGVDKGVAVEIGPHGGTLIAGDGAVVLEVPAGALSKPVTIRAVRVPEDREFPRSGLVAGSVYSFEPSGLRFERPATLTLAFDPERVRTGLDPASLVVLSAVHGSQAEDDVWQEQRSRVDLENARVTGTITHFSHQGVGEPVVEISVAPASLD